MFGIVDFGAFVAAFIILLFIPGPGNLAIITSTTKGGIKGGMAAAERLVLVVVELGHHLHQPLRAHRALGGSRRCGGGAGRLPGRIPRGAVVGRSLPGVAGFQDADG